MSCITACTPRRRARRTELPGRLAPPKVITGRSLRRGAAGVAGTGLVYGGLLAVTADDNPIFGTGWVGSAAENARPFGAAVTTGWATFSQATTAALGRVETFAAWPLIALALLWLASRNQPVYLRGALALFVSNAAGLAVFASVRGFPADEAALVGGYLALPGVRAGGYVLMALAVVALTARRPVRAAATAVALLAVTTAVLTPDHHVLGTLSAAVAPLLAWYGVAAIESRRSAGRRTVEAASPVTVPEAGVLPLRPRTEAAPEEGVDAGPVRLPRAG
ncbi:hypothetical protein ACFYXF_31385 [Streptomyces sp. NPDC002680]|uniref:hypothetical protein n=1 Tax=Streptomyces sp. NPDC002680 TaxID=3364659 RepID=UPI0036C1544B